MAYALPKALQAKVLNGLISTLKLHNTTIQDLLGVGINGAYSIPKRGYVFTYDIMDPTRNSATARMPGQVSATVQPQVVGQVTGRYVRSAEKLPLLLAYLQDLRVLGGNQNEIDAGGQRYITEQFTRLMQRFANAREVECAAMLRGNLYLTPSGDDLYREFSSSGAAIDIDFRIPAANKTQLALGTGADTISASWATAATDIVGDVLNIMRGFELQSGYTVGAFITSPEIANFMVQNTSVRQAAGTSGPPFQVVELQGSNDVYYTFKAFPWIRVYVVNEVLGVGTAQTTTRMVGANDLFVIPRPDGMWCQYWTGSEPVIEEFNRRQHEPQGLYSWTELRGDPARAELIANMIGMPILQVPKAVAYGTAVF